MANPRASASSSEQLYRPPPVPSRRRAAPSALGHLRDVPEAASRLWLPSGRHDCSGRFGGRNLPTLHAGCNLTADTSGAQPHQAPGAAQAPGLTETSARAAGTLGSEYPFSPHRRPWKFPPLRASLRATPQAPILSLWPQAHLRSTQRGAPQAAHREGDPHASRSPTLRPGSPSGASSVDRRVPQGHFHVGAMEIVVSERRTQEFDGAVGLLRPTPRLGQGLTAR